jgi:outer membrane biosynthesis protein TonB
METDSSQVTGEKPTDAKYYSDKSTVAANPKNPTDKQDNTPYLEGKDAHVISSTDVPTPSGAATPSIRPGAPASPVSPPSPPKPVPTTPPQPKAVPSQPQEVAPLGVKIVEEQKMAMVPKANTHQPEVVTGADVPASPPEVTNPVGAGAPSAPSDPGVPGREIVARKAHLTVAGVTRTGVAAFGVEENPFGAYDKKIIKSVQSRWYALIDRFGMYERAGAVTVHFQLLDDGQVQTLKVSDNTAGEILSLFCEKAIIESGPFDPLPDNLRALVGKEPRDASFTFYY